MNALRTLLATLLLAAVLAPSAARAGEQEDQAQMFIGLLEIMCPGLVAEGMTKEEMFGAGGAALATGISNDSCSCINTDLRAMPARKVVALLEAGDDNKVLEGMMTTCMAKALKPRIGEVCLAAARKEAGEGADEAKLTAACGCAQRRADAISDERMAEMMNSSDENSLDAIFEGCDADA